MGMEPAVTVWTIGHSTRTLKELIALLHAHGIAHLVDVRTIPRSRRNPQFNQRTLAAGLHSAGIAYTHLPALGGLRHARADSSNTAWRNASFRGYADHMQTAQFEEGLERLLACARLVPTAIMCAEAVPGRCHRSLIADALTARGIDALHITSPTRAALHRLTPWARIAGTRVTYPGGPTEEAADAAQDTFDWPR